VENAHQIIKVYRYKVDISEILKEIRLNSGWRACDTQMSNMLEYEGIEDFTAQLFQTYCYF
jgi:hypothetical protein